MMWRCEICSELIDEPSVYHYREDMNGEGAWQDFYVDYCPFCGGEDLEPLPEPEDDLTAEEETEINRRDFEEWEERQWHI